MTWKINVLSHKTFCPYIFERMLPSSFGESSLMLTFPVKTF